MFKKKRICPKCGRTQLFDDTVCPYCGCNLDGEPQSFRTVKQEADRQRKAIHISFTFAKKLSSQGTWGPGIFALLALMLVPMLCFSNTSTMAPVKTKVPKSNPSPTIVEVGLQAFDRLLEQTPYSKEKFEEKMILEGFSSEEVESYLEDSSIDWQALALRKLYLLHEKSGFSIEHAKKVMEKEGYPPEDIQYAVSALED